VDWFGYKDEGARVTMSEALIEHKMLFE